MHDDTFGSKSKSYRYCKVHNHSSWLLKGSQSPAKNENKLDKDLICTLERFVLICSIQSNQVRSESLMHEFSSNVNIR